MNKLTAIVARIGDLLRTDEVRISRPDADAGPPTRGPLAAPQRGEDLTAEHGAGHAPGHRHIGPPPEMPVPHSASVPPPRHTAWHDIGGRVDRLRRNERRRG